MKAENPVRDKSYLFALRIIDTYRQLTEQRREFILSKQLLRSGTSIGANVEEALGGHSPKDFRSKMSIAYKEALESDYWIRLLRDSQYLTVEQSDDLLCMLSELLKILGKIQQTMKAKAL